MKTYITPISASLEKWYGEIPRSEYQFSLDADILTSLDIKLDNKMSLPYRLIATGYLNEARVDFSGQYSIDFASSVTLKNPLNGTSVKVKKSAFELEYVKSVIRNVIDKNFDNESFTTEEDF